MKRFVQVHQGTVWVHENGRVYSFSKEEPKHRSTDTVAELIAPFACRVRKLFVTRGQSVKKGDPIVSVEAMKMEYSYTAPFDGVIAETLVTEGAMVPQAAEFVSWEKK
jgi:3-methylcrotonyl-CoA carboxylase alpha subunit